MPSLSFCVEFNIDVKQWALCISSRVWGVHKFTEEKMRVNLGIENLCNRNSFDLTDMIVMAMHRISYSYLVNYK